MYPVYCQAIIKMDRAFDEYHLCIDQDGKHDVLFMLNVIEYYFRSKAILKYNPVCFSGPDFSLFFAFLFNKFVLQYNQTNIHKRDALSLKNHLEVL